MIRSKITMGFIWGLLALALHVWPMTPVALAQGSRKDDIVFNPRGVPMAGATVRVCAMPASGQPCTPLAQIYSDPGLTQALANPTASDGVGNYFFYAAPGRYMIEISGPGITTKQLANVILPSDPTSPNFSSISSSGGISAFSLNLTGNLSVNGNTTVNGSLGSGTLNLANQSTPPGAAGTGTVNLYTKTTDKRLYYKDETGAEISPIANTTGAQTNVTNTFTAPQNIDADFHNKGPNPVYDITRYGGYIAYPIPSTTGSINSGTTALTLAAAQDFANVHGILVLGAGPATALSTPTGVQATPQGVTGSTTYNYAVVAEDYAGGRTAVSATGASTTSAATLGINSFTLASCNRASGVVTCNTTVTHNIVALSQINIVAGSTGDNSFEGAFTTVTASGTAFTFNQIGMPDASGTVTSGTVQVVAKNWVQWNFGAGYAVLRSYVYRCTTTCTLPGNAANYALAGVAQGMDSSFTDLGFSVSTANIGNGDVPATAPTSASNQWLSTTISSGGGTTSLTLANAASNTVAGAVVLHDNAPNILATCSIQGNGNGGTILIPKSAASSQFPINSTLNLGSCVLRTKLLVETQLITNGSIIPGNRGEIVGSGGSDNAGIPEFYDIGDIAHVWGKAYPDIYILPGTSTNIYFASLHVRCDSPYQACIYHDEDKTGNNATGARFDNVHLQTATGTGGPVYVLKGGFGYFWNYGGMGTNASGFASPPAFLMTPDCGLGVSAQQLPGIVYFDKTYIFGGSVIETCGESSLTGSDHMEFKELLVESSYVPMMRVNGTGAITRGLYFINPTYADQLGGIQTPMFDCTNGNCYDINFYNANANQGPIVETLTNATGGYNFYGTTGSGAPTYISRTLQQPVQDVYSNANLALAAGSTSHVFYQMALPAVPQSAVVSAGGSVPIAALRYAATGVDVDGNETLLGLPVSATTTSGQQTVTVTLPASFPAGAVGLNLYRSENGGGYAKVNAAGCASPQFTTLGGTYVDIFAAGCGNSAPSVNSAGASLLSSSGVSSYKYRVGGESFTASPRGEQNVFLPGALTATWIGATWTLDKAITVTRVQVQTKTAPASCTTNAVARLTDGSTPVNVTISAASNDSGGISQNYAAGAGLTVSVQTAAAGCSTSPADANVTIQYRMQ